jgi:type IV secretory pathway VirB4 component
VSRWLTSAQLAPLVRPGHDGGTGLVGRPLGLAQRGGPFVYDPFDAYRAGLVTNPNVLVTGAIGVGKSTVVKMLLARALAAGRRAVVLDPKGEYRDLAAAVGGRVVTPGAGDGWGQAFGAGRREDLGLLEALVATSLARALADDERYALGATYDALGRDHGGSLVAALLRRLAPHLGDRAGSPERTLAHCLHRFVDGDLAGLFDAAAEAPGGADDRLVVLDLSAAWAAEALALVALAAMAAARRSLEGAEAGYLVLDEAWAVLGEPRVAHWLQGSWKLARARAVSHVLVLHRWSDAFTAADEGTAQRAKVTAILRDCETAVLLRQDAGERALLERVLDLGPREQAAATELGRGTALVRYGPHRSIVRFTPDEADRRVIDTDQAMRSAR